MTSIPSIPWNFSWFIDGKLAGMAYPRDKHVPFLLASGLQTIVNLTPFPADYEDTAKTHGITVYNITIEDFEAPSYDQIKYFLDICRNSETVSRFLIFASSDMRRCAVVIIFSSLYLGCCSTLWQRNGTHWYHVSMLPGCQGGIKSSRCYHGDKTQKNLLH